MKELELITGVFTVLGQDVVERHVADLIISIPKAVETIRAGKPVIMLCRTTGADNIERFRGCIESEEVGKKKRVITDDECVRYCAETLGWDIKVTIHPSGIIQAVRNPEGSLVEYKFAGLRYRFLDCGLRYRFLDCRGVNEVIML